MKKKFKLEQKHIDYFKKVIPELIEAEQTVDRIKDSYEWKRAYNYFNVLRVRGHIKEMPTKKNGYKIEFFEDVIDIKRLEGIVTAEQMEQIKALINN